MLKYFAAVVFLLFAGLLNFLLLRPAVTKPAYDFAQFYFAGELISDGKLADLYDPAAYAPYIERVKQGDGVADMQPFVYFNRPPFSAPLYWPYAWLPYATSAKVFLALNFALWAFLIWKLPSWLAAPGIVRLWLFSAFPLAYAVGVGQDTIGLTLLVAYSLCVLIHRNQTAAGMMLGFCLIKPHLLLFLPILLLVEKKYKALAAFILTGIVLAGLSIAFVGIHGIEQWIELLKAPTTDFYPADMGTIRALGLRFGWAVAIPAGTVALCSGVLAFLYGDYRQRLSVCLVLGLLVSPHAYWGDYTLLTIVALITPNWFIRYAILLPWAYFIPITMWPMVLCSISFLILMAVRSLPKVSLSHFLRVLAYKMGRSALEVSSTNLQ